MEIARKAAISFLVFTVLCGFLWLTQRIRTVEGRLSAMQRGTASTAWRAQCLSEDLRDVRKRVAHLEDENWTNVDGATAQR